MSYQKKKSNHKNIFTSCDGILLHGECIVIPASMKKKILKELHMGHLGIIRMKFLMKSYVYWPGMD